MRTIAGGIVLDPFAPAGRSPGEALAPLERDAPAEALREVVQGRAAGVGLDWFERTYNLPPHRAEALLPPGAVVLEGDARTAFGAGHADALHEQLLVRLKAFHAEHPDATGGEPLAVLRQAVAPALAAEDFAQLMRRLATRGRIELRGTQARMAGQGVAANPRDVLAWQKVQPMLQDAAASIPSVRELSEMATLPLQQLRDLLHRRSAAGELVKLTPDRFALPRTMAMLAGKARDTAAAAPGGLFTAAEYRDRIGTGRGLAIEILECLDRHGVTQRRGANARVWVGGDADPGTFFRTG